VIADPIGQATRWLASGGMLAYPTETVWGLGADALSEAAVARLLGWKGRGSDDPLALLVESRLEAEAAGFELGEAAIGLAERFWPGPLTLVVRTARRFAAGVAREDGAVGLRCSLHPLAAALARRLRRDGVGPITATSLNRSGEPPARSIAEARALCDGDDAELPRLIAVEGAEAGGDAPSTVVDATGEVPRVLRWGAVVQDDLVPLLAEVGGS
jgi:tRNA threonylcarbamoyl adenosine modification protein (Sua5/YciO/YrdC/YwlC family)